MTLFTCSLIVACGVTFERPPNLASLPVLFLVDECVNLAALALRLALAVVSVDWSMVAGGGVL